MRLGIRVVLMVLVLLTGGSWKLAAPLAAAVHADLGNSLTQSISAMVVRAGARRFWIPRCNSAGARPGRSPGKALLRHNAAGLTAHAIERGLLY